MLGIGCMSCSLTRRIAAPKSQNFFQKRRAKLHFEDDGQKGKFRIWTQQNGSHLGEQELNVWMSFFVKKDI